MSFVSEENLREGEQKKKVITRKRMTTEEVDACFAELARALEEKGLNSLEERRAFVREVRKEIWGG